MKVNSLTLKTSLLKVKTRIFRWNDLTRTYGTRAPTSRLRPAGASDVAENGVFFRWGRAAQVNLKG